MSTDCKYVKQDYQHIKKVKYFSEVCTAQYKNCEYFLNLFHHCTHFNLEAEWNFFSTNHGKPAV